MIITIINNIIILKFKKKIIIIMKDRPRRFWYYYYYYHYKCKDYCDTVTKKCRNGTVQDTVSQTVTRRVKMMLTVINIQNDLPVDKKFNAHNVSRDDVPKLNQNSSIS